MPVTATELEDAIRATIPVTYLEVHDTSSGCGSNYSVVIVSDVFEGKTSLARHRFVNDALKTQIAQMHAFSQKTWTSKQWAAMKEKEKEEAVAASA